MKSLLKIFLLLTIFSSCMKEDELCDCQKTIYYVDEITKDITSKTFSIPFEDYGDIDGYGGTDENGDSYFVSCE